MRHAVSDQVLDSLYEAVFSTGNLIQEKEKTITYEYVSEDERGLRMGSSSTTSYVVLGQREASWGEAAPIWIMSSEADFEQYKRELYRVQSLAYFDFLKQERGAGLRAEARGEWIEFDPDFIAQARSFYRELPSVKTVGKPDRPFKPSLNATYIAKARAVRKQIPDFIPYSDTNPFGRTLASVYDDVLMQYKKNAKELWDAASAMLGE